MKDVSIEPVAGRVIHVMIEVVHHQQFYADRIERVEISRHCRGNVFRMLHYEEVVVTRLEFVIHGEVHPEEVNDEKEEQCHENLIVFGRMLHIDVSHCHTCAVGVSELYVFNCLSAAVCSTPKRRFGSARRVYL